MTSNRCVGVVGRDDERLLAIAAIHADYAHEIAKLKMQIVRYRGELEANGIEPPDMEGADLLAMWENCRKVIETAFEFVVGLGTTKEFIAGAWRK